MAQVTLLSSDGHTFVVDQSVISASSTIEGMIEMIEGTDVKIPIPNVTGRVLAKVIEFCKLRADAGYADFVEKEIGADTAMLFDLMLASNYLNVKSLLDLTTKTTANMIKGKTPEEIRKTFGIKNDFTPEEEEEVRRENQWAFD